MLKTEVNDLLTQTGPRKLWRAVEALRDEGVKPPGLDPAHQRVRSVAIVLPADEPFAESCRKELTVRPGERHASV